MRSFSAIQRATTAMSEKPMFAGASVLLTGVGREGQVGEVVADAFAREGARLILVDRTRDEVESRAAALRAKGHDAVALPTDLTDDGQVATLAAAVDKRVSGRLHALVHMAGGFAMSGPIADSDVGVWNRQVAINLTTAFLTTRALLPMLRTGRGAIVYFASEAALPGARVAAMAAYAVAKAGVVTLMRAVAQEERGNGVRANAVAPSSIRTTTNVQAMGDGVRYVEREEVADSVLYLCSEHSSAISGQLVRLG